MAVSKEQTENEKMKKFTNALDNIKIASPCPADWNEMRGDDRKRFCSECKLNVYNLSDMTVTEAESFLINSEGRVCINYYRRKDGTVLTKDCPVGWQLLKKRVSRVTTAVFASMFGIFTGLFAFQQFEVNPLELKSKVVVETHNSIVDEPFIPIGYDELPPNSFKGEPENLDEIRKELRENSQHKERIGGRYENIRKLEDEPVVAWIQ